MGMIGATGAWSVAIGIIPVDLIVLLGHGRLRLQVGRWQSGAIAVGWLVLLPIELGLLVYGCGSLRDVGRWTTVFHGCRVTRFFRHGLIGDRLVRGGGSTTGSR